DLAKRAVAGDPQNPGLLHTLASIQVRLRGWPHAATALFEWIRLADRGFVADGRADTVATFREVLAQAPPAELAALLRQPGVGPHWAPWVAAIASLAGEVPSAALDPDAAALREEISRA